MEEGSRLAPGKAHLYTATNRFLLITKKECYDEKTFTT